MVFTTLVESVYSAIRTDSLCKADFVSSLKGYTTPIEETVSAIELLYLSKGAI